MGNTGWSEELEREAIKIYRAAHAEPDRPAAIGDLVKEILRTKIERAALAFGHESDKCQIKSETRIYVRKGIPAPRANWLAAHELAHIWFERAGYRPPDLEAKCDALGAALIVPRPAWQRIRREIEGEILLLAKELGTTQSLVLLRTGECEALPVALVQHRRTRVRGGWDERQEPQILKAVGAVCDG